MSPKQLAARSCPYTVVIKTSCSSPSYTRDKISLAFGDSYGNEVYAKRIDDPSSGTFGRCSTDTFKINGPCVYNICYQYLLRVGSDGWKPQSVKIYGPYTKTVNFDYNTFLPNGVWYGFNLCPKASLSASSIISLPLPTQPRLSSSFLPRTVQAARSCAYTVIIKTSCSSTAYTRDKISLAFGDSYGKEVYAERIDNPSSRTFERCSTDTFKINGPCVYDICYQYLLRVGSDGWKPQSVKIYGPFTKTVNFDYNTFLPNAVWYGFNLCRKS
ncbi:hypothetical protein Tsubulata_013879 [Turnera subulata]|uniref:Uncharacterized protein n=1 Tax=Turnera subulata TaxID=218843 RepID=A0A9Q0FW17_9ROSI|nr:hypothetical protein Tsubulata_013879 [Turnera subulata]